MQWCNIALNKRLRIDTSGRGVDCGAPFKKVLLSCSLTKYNILYSIRKAIINLSIDMSNNEIGWSVPMVLCLESENKHFSHILFEHFLLLYTNMLEDLGIYCQHQFGRKGVSKY